MINIRRNTITRLRDRLKETGSRPSLVIASGDPILAKAGVLPPEEQAAIQSVEPVLEMMFLMMAADGAIQEEERVVIRGAVRELTEGFVRSATLNALIEGLEEVLNKDGQQARLDAVVEMLQDDVPGAESAFVLAAAVAYADEKIEDTENELLNAFAEKAGISEERANALLDELEQDWQTES
jgi:uncharacterized tellurite resistance protein B-like protein